VSNHEIDRVEGSPLANSKKLTGSTNPVWFVGPAVLSIYNFGGEQGFLPKARAEELSKKASEAASRGEVYSLNYEEVNRDMEAILKVAPGAFELFWRSQPSSNRQQSEVIVRASYAVTQPTLREVARCFAMTTLMDTNSVYNVLIEEERESSLRLMPKFAIYDWQHLFFVKQFLIALSQLGETGECPVKMLIYQGRRADPAGFIDRLPEIGFCSDQCTEIVWDNDVLDQASILANPASAQNFESLVNPILISRRSFSGVHEQVLAFIDTQLRAGLDVSMPLAAKAFGMEASTLRRRLIQEGSKFGQILQDYRRKDAMRLLGRGYSVTEASKKLGYAEASSFQHAFKTWFGAPPKRFYRSTAP
jgi:AraC-like DNA-binding protein